MSDGKIHIPARRKQPVGDQMVVKVTPEAYNALVDIYNESTLSLKQIASLLIVKAAEQKRFPWMIVRKAKKASIIDRIRCTIRLMGAGRFWITEDCKSLQTALSDAVWNKDVKDKDERLDDGSTDIDSLDAFEYTIERDMRDLIEEVENV